MDDGGYGSDWVKTEAYKVIVFADAALAALLENDEIECRQDEDCDHCVATQALKETTKWIEEHKSEPSIQRLISRQGW